MGLGQMKSIGRDAIAQQFRQWDGAALHHPFFRLEDQKSSPLAQDQSGSILVKWTNFLRRSSLQGIEADKDQLAQRLVASTHHTSSHPMSHQLESVPDRVGTRRTSVGENLARDPQLIQFERVQNRLLRRI